MSVKWDCKITVEQALCPRLHVSVTKVELAVWERGSGAGRNAGKERFIE